MPEAVIVATGRTPIGRANKGSLVDCRPDDLAALAVREVLDKVPQLDPQQRRGRHPGLRPARRRGRVQHRPGGGHSGRTAQRARRDREPLLLVVAAGHPHGRPRHPGRRRRRLRGRRGGDGQPLPLRRRRHRAPQPPVRRRRGPHRGPHPGLHRAVDALRRAPRRLHRHGPDGRERGRAEGRLPPGPGRVRRTVPDPGRGRPGGRLLRPGDHPGDPAQRRRGHQGRRPPARHQPGEALHPPAGVPRGRHGHGGQRLPAERRLGRRGGHERHPGPGAGHHAARPGGGQRRHRAWTPRSWASDRWRPSARPSSGPT